MVPPASRTAVTASTSVPAAARTGMEAQSNGAAEAGARVSVPTDALVSGLADATDARLYA